MKLFELNIEEAHQGLVEKEFTSEELTQAVLEQIEKKDKDIFAYLTVTPELALKKAKEIDAGIARGDQIHPLAGIPLAVKDNILAEGIKCTAGSKILENYIAPYNATVIEKLKEVGAIIVGKTNLDEFAMGSSGENSALRPTKNPYDLERVPGGSSSGSAAAVASNQCICALGSDTGGSIRQPAGFCGVIGLKPTYGAVSRYGLIAMASSLDQIGPVTKTVKDAKIVFEVIRGKDPLDSTSVESNVQNLKSNIQNLRIGIPKECFSEGIDRKVEKVVKEAIDKFVKLGASVEEVSLPHLPYSLASYYIIMPSEASANLARYDGIRFGFTKTNPKFQNPSNKTQNLIDGYFKTRGEGFGEEVRRRIMLGTYALSAGYYEAYYLKAQKVRALIKEDFNKVFSKIDILLMPTSPTLPFKLGEKTKDPLSMYLSDIYTVSINLAGLPGLSIPCGKINNLPVGLQIIGKPFSEELLFQVGQIFEQSNT